MNEQEIRARIAANIAHYRREMGLTQIELSERINYSDKSVSKWERGEGVPDVYVLVRLAEVFGVGVGDFLSASPRHRRAGGTRQRVCITLMAAVLVWLVATIAFFFCSLFLEADAGYWLSFIAAIPVMGIVLTVFSVKWWHLVWQFLSVSLIEWGVAVFCHLLLSRVAYVPNMPNIYPACAVLQVLTLLWFAFQYIRKRARHPA